MQRILIIGVAGLVGTLSRYWLSDWIARRSTVRFPAATLLINLSGCLLAGFLFYLFDRRYPADETLQTAIFVGFLGAYTTFSAVGLGTFTLLRSGELALAALYLIGTNLGGLALVYAGYNLARMILN